MVNFAGRLDRMEKRIAEAHRREVRHGYSDDALNRMCLEVFGVAFPAAI